MSGSGLVLRGNGGGDLAISTGGALMFTAAVASSKFLQALNRSDNSTSAFESKRTAQQ